ncbi:MAG: helix-turn-helix domain-containing protein [Pseudomonadota bacterium]
MAGARQFNEEKALDAAMRVFWEKGYTATTIDDLVGATGVKRGSLYLAYRNKEGLFLKAFETYTAKINDPLLDMLDSGDLLTSLRRVFELQARGGGADHPPGCLITQSAAELGARRDTLGAATRNVLDQIEQRLRSRIERAASEREISRGTNAGQLTQLVAGTMRTLPLLRKASGGASAQSMADASMSAIRAWVK